MKKNILVSFVLTAAFVFGAFFAASAANAQASSLWGAAQQQLGANASSSAVMSLAKSLAIRFGIAVPEWGIPGTKDARTLGKDFFNSIIGRQASADLPVVYVLSPLTGQTFGFSNGYLNILVTTDNTDVSVTGLINGITPLSCDSYNDTGIQWQVGCPVTLSLGLNTVTIDASGRNSDADPYTFIGSTTWTGTYTPSSTPNFATAAQLYMDNVAVSNLTSHEILLNGTRSFRVEPLPAGTQFASTDPTGVSSWRTGDFSFDTISIDPISNSFSTTVTGEAINTAVLLTDVKTCVQSDSGTKGVCPDGFVEQFLVMPGGFHTNQIFLKVVNQYTQPGPVYASSTNGIDVVPASQTIGVGQNYPLVANANPSGSIFASPVSWSSANSTIASVDPVSGIVTGVAPGTVRITATTTTCVVSNARANSNLATVLAGVSACPPEYFQTTISDFSDITVTSGQPTDLAFPSIFNERPMFCNAGPAVNQATAAVLAVTQIPTCSVTINVPDLVISGRITDDVSVSSFTIIQTGGAPAELVLSRVEIPGGNSPASFFYNYTLPAPGGYTFLEDAVDGAGHHTILIKEINYNPIVSTPLSITNDAPYFCTTNQNLAVPLGADCDFGTIVANSVNLTGSVAGSNIASFTIDVVGGEYQNSFDPALNDNRFNEEINFPFPGRYTITETLRNTAGEAVVLVKHFNTDPRVNDNITPTLINKIFLFGRNYPEGYELPVPCQVGGNIVNNNASAILALDVPTNDITCDYGTIPFDTNVVLDVSISDNIDNNIIFFRADLVWPTGSENLFEMETESYPAFENQQFRNEITGQLMPGTSYEIQERLVDGNKNIVTITKKFKTATAISLTNTVTDVSFSPAPVVPGTCAVVGEGEEVCTYPTTSSTSLAILAEARMNNPGNQMATITVTAEAPGGQTRLLCAASRQEEVGIVDFISCNGILSFTSVPFIGQSGIYTVTEVATDGDGHTYTVTKNFEFVSPDNVKPQIFNRLSANGRILTATCGTSTAGAAALAFTVSCCPSQPQIFNRSDSNTAAAGLAILLEPSADCYYGIINTANVTWGATVVDTNNSGQSSAISFFNAILIPPVGSGLPPVALAGNPPIPNPTPTPYLAPDVNLSPYLTVSGLWTIRETARDIYGNVATLTKTFDVQLDNIPADIINTLTVGGNIIPGICTIEPATGAIGATAVLAGTMPVGVTKIVNCSYPSVSQANAVIGLDINDNSRLLGSVLVYATAPGGLPVEIYNSNNLNPALVINPGLTTPLHIDIPYLFGIPGSYLIEERVVDTAGNLSILRKNIPYNPDRDPVDIINRLSVDGTEILVPCAVGGLNNSATCDYGTTGGQNVVISGQISDPGSIATGVGNLQLNRAPSVNNTAATTLAITAGLTMFYDGPNQVQGGVPTNFPFTVVNPIGSNPLVCTIDAGDGRPLLTGIHPVLQNNEVAALLAISGSVYRGSVTLTYGVTGEPITRSLTISCVDEMDSDNTGSITVPITVNPAAPTGAITYSGFNPTSVIVGQQRQYAVVISDSGANPPALSCTVQTGDDAFYHTGPDGGLTVLPSGSGWVANYFHTYNTQTVYTATITCNDSANNLFNQVGSFDVEVGSQLPPPPLPGGVIRSFTITATAPGQLPVEIYNSTAPLFSVPYLLTDAGVYTWVETAVDAAGNISTVTKILNYRPDREPPVLDNKVYVNGREIIPVCTPGLPLPTATAILADLPPNIMTCDYGVINQTSPFMNLDVKFTVTDNSGRLSSVRAEWSDPSFNTTNFANVSDVPSPYSANTSIRLTQAGRYMVNESATDPNRNFANIIKIWEYVPDTTNPVFRNTLTVGGEGIQPVECNPVATTPFPFPPAAPVAGETCDFGTVYDADAVLDASVNDNSGSVRNVTVFVKTPGGLPVPIYNAPAPVPCPIGQPCLPPILPTVYSFSVPYTFTIGGEYVFYEMTGDQAGNIGTMTKTVNYQPDIVAPEVVNNNYSGPQITNNPTYNVSGTVNDPAISAGLQGTMSVTLNGSPVLPDPILTPAPSAPGASAATFAFSVTLVEGLNKISETVCDIVPNCTTFTKEVTLDTIAPKLTNNERTPQTVYAAAFTVSGFVSDSGTGVKSFTVNGNPVVINPDGSYSTVITLVPGLNIIKEVACDFAGNCSNFTKEITYYVAQFKVSVQLVNGFVKPPTNTDQEFPARVYAANAICGTTTLSTLGFKPINYETIWNTCKYESEALETGSLQVGKQPQNLRFELKGPGATTLGDHYVLVQSMKKSNGYAYAGFQTPDLKLGDIRNLGYELPPGQPTKFIPTAFFTITSKDEIQSSRVAQTVFGSFMQIINPEYVDWANGSQTYPFVFIADSGFDVDVCLNVPQGYKIVAPGTCGQTFVDNEVKVLEFSVQDVGSPKNFDVGAKLKIKHKGKTHNFDLKIPSHNRHANGR